MKVMIRLRCMKDYNFSSMSYSYDFFLLQPQPCITGKGCSVVVCAND